MAPLEPLGRVRDGRSLVLKNSAYLLPAGSPRPGPDSTRAGLLCPVPLGFQLRKPRSAKGRGPERPSLTGLMPPPDAHTAGHRGPQQRLSTRPPQMPSACPPHAQHVAHRRESRSSPYVTALCPPHEPHNPHKRPAVTITCPTVPTYPPRTPSPHIRPMWPPRTLQIASLTRFLCGPHVTTT